MMWLRGERVLWGSVARSTGRGCGGASVGPLQCRAVQRMCTCESAGLGDVQSKGKCSYGVHAVQV